MDKQNQSVIIAKDLDLGYKNKILVTNVNLSIYKGEFIGILGPNGSGKSTFLKTILGCLHPLAGHLSVLGTKPQHGHAKIGYMPQMRSTHAITFLSGRALLEAAYEGLGYGLSLPHKSKTAELSQVLDLVKAEQYADRPFHQLSGGEKQRIFLAQALLGGPQLLLLDEPLSSLDPQYQEIFINLLHKIQTNLKVTILFTAHDPNPLLPVLTRVLFFARGQALIGTLTEIITSTTLSQLYGTPIEVLHLDKRLLVLANGQNILGEVRHQHG